MDQIVSLRSNKRKLKRCNPCSDLVDKCLTKLNGLTCCIKSWIIFTLLCFITCQYVPHKKESKMLKVLIPFYTVIFTVGFGSIVNIWPTALILFDWITCPIRYFDVCYTLLSYNRSTEYAVPNILLLGATSNPNNISDSTTADELKSFIAYEKIVLLFSAVSGTISYLIFIYCVLCPLYIRKHQPWARCCGIDEYEADRNATGGGAAGNEARNAPEAPPLEATQPEDTPEAKPPKDTPSEEARPLLEAAPQSTTQAAPQAIPPRDAENETPVSLLHPFDDSDNQANGENGNNNTSTRLEKNERIRFWLFWLLSISLFIAMCIVFFVHYNKHHPLSQQQDHTNIKYRYNIAIIKGFEISTAVAYFYSLFCTISSCFIFSKVMYGVQNQCNGLFRVDNTIKEFKREDKRFTEMAIETQKPFEMWFFIHWAMYIVTSFLSLSFFFEAVNKKIQASVVKPDSGIGFHDLEFALIALLAATNSFVFLYPCIRAAGVTESRKSLIREVNDSIDFEDGNNPTNDAKRAFISYLKERNFGFRLNIFCAHVKFNLNIAYISIFIGLLGVLIKVGSSI